VDRNVYLASAKVAPKANRTSEMAVPSTSETRLFQALNRILSMQPPDDIGEFCCRTRSTSQGLCLCIRPENTEVQLKKPASKLNVLAGKVEIMAFLGEYKDVTIAVGNDLVRARLHPQSKVRRGDSVYLHVPPQALVVVDQ